MSQQPHGTLAVSAAGDAEQRVAAERYRLVLESMGSMIFDHDFVRDSTFRSDSVAELFRWDEVEPTAEWWIERIHPDDVERVTGGVYAEIARGPMERWEVEYRFRRGDDSWAAVLERGTVIRNDSGQAVRCIGTVTDVSDRAELASQLRQAQKMDAVGQLAGGIAHDFNNLLTAISCNVELLLDATDPTDARRDDIIQISEAATRAATLTRQLLAFSRRQMLQPKPLDLNGTVASMERMLRRVIGGDVRLLTKLDASLPAVHADAGQMEQVVMNLVLNARDAMPDGGDILVTTATTTLRSALQHRFGAVAPGRYVVLTVRDYGCGIPAEVYEHLFEPFFTTKAQGKGTGLGLATVHGIVIQSGGHVVVESVEGQGTEFRVYLPAYAGAVPVGHPSPPAGLPVIAGQSRTVLVVDDDAAVRDVAVRALARAGFRVIGAMGGEAALSLLAKQSDRDSILVLSDLLMPGMSGAQLAAQVARQHPAARVAFMSGYSTDELAPSGLESEMHTLLNKPFTLPELVGFVERAFAATEVTEA
jgi:two-component system cell cycle sensor histidine kinase/response regulator CckA